MATEPRDPRTDPRPGDILRKGDFVRVVEVHFSGSECRYREYRMPSMQLQAVGCSFNSGWQEDMRGAVVLKKLPPSLPGL